VGSPAVPPRLELPPRGRRSRKLESWARRPCVSPYGVGARVATRASLPTASTNPARVMAPPPVSRRILLGSRHQKKIRTVAQRGWQSRQLKASGATRTGKQEARRQPDDRGRRSECTGQSCLVGSPRLAWIWWCVGERFGDESESGKARAGVLVGSPASLHKQVLSLGAGPDMRRGKEMTGRPNIGGLNSLL
jgi:hypothetical protein